MIYLDNSATSYPKPQSVISSFSVSMRKFGGNAGRGGYKMALDTSEKIFQARENTADFFGCPNPENVVFTYNCTIALNMAIKGVAKKKGHLIISDIEHNAVLRPVDKLKNDGFCDYSVAEICYEDDERTVNNFKKLIKSNTVAIICSGASNVFGILSPYKKLAKLAHEHGLLFIMDTAQVGGILPINMIDDDIDILCCAGHKGLYGPTGTGILLFKDGLHLDTIIEGGTGSNSSVYSQPEIFPDRFESGTPNVSGIIALNNGIDFVRKKGIENIYKHETGCINYLENELKKNNDIIFYVNRRKYSFAPILSFNVKGYHSEAVSQHLAADNICVRAGLHCAPLAHKKMKTENFGTVRISPSIFTKKSDLDFLIKSLKKLQK